MIRAAHSISKRTGSKLQAKSNIGPEARGLLQRLRLNAIVSRPVVMPRYRLVRGGSRGGAVDGCVGADHSADQSLAWGTNHDANKATKSADLRVGGGANAAPMAPPTTADH